MAELTQEQLQQAMAQMSEEVSEVDFLETSILLDFDGRAQEVPVLIEKNEHKKTAEKYPFKVTYTKSGSTCYYTKHRLVSDVEDSSAISQILAMLK